MDLKSVMDKDIEVDIESGLPLIEDNSMRNSDPCTARQGNALYAKVPGFSGDENGSSLYLNDYNFSEVSLDMMKAINKSPTKEKRKKASNKKFAKPPRPPQGPQLDAADLKLIRELSERAMLKRARIERMKALRKMRASKSSSSNASSILALIFTIIFFIVIIFQGMSSGKPSVASFQGSPISEEALISVQYNLNPSSDSYAPGSVEYQPNPSTDSYAPGSESPK